MVINELLAPAQPITWLPWAVQYFFLIGLAYGALWLGAFELWRKAPDPRLQTLAAVLMVAASLVAPIALTADLHQPARAWHFYAQTRAWLRHGMAPICCRCSACSPCCSAGCC
jgi:tetrathionate reductase subunit C